MAFIEKLDGPALNLSPEEFEGYMLHQRAPSARAKRLQIASDTEQLLEELKDRQEKLDQGMDALNMQLQNWVEAVNSQMDDATSQFVLVQKEITAQEKTCQVSSSSAHEASDDKDHSVVVLTEPCAEPKDSDC